MTSNQEGEPSDLNPQQELILQGYMDAHETSKDPELVAALDQAVAEMRERGLQGAFSSMWQMIKSITM